MMLLYPPQVVSVLLLVMLAVEFSILLEFSKASLVLVVLTFPIEPIILLSLPIHSVFFSTLLLVFYLPLVVNEYKPCKGPEG